MGGANKKPRGGRHQGQLAEFAGAVAEDLRQLVALHHQEPDAALLNALRQTAFPRGLGLRLQGEGGLRALDLMDRALAALPKELDQPVMDELAADYASIYLTHGIQASPEESVWIDDENLACQQPMFQVRAWYARHDLAAPDWRTRPDDHLVLQLQFIAHLLAGEGVHNRLDEVARFMDEHLLRWLGRFADRVAARSITPYFAGVALLTAAYCDELRDILVETLGEPRPSTEEIDARMRPRYQQEQRPVAFMPGMGPAV